MPITITENILKLIWRRDLHFKLSCTTVSSVIIGEMFITNCWGRGESDSREVTASARPALSIRVKNGKERGRGQTQCGLFLFPEDTLNLHTHQETNPEIVLDHLPTLNNQAKIKLTCTKGKCQRLPRFQYPSSSFLSSNAKSIPD